LRVTGKSQVSIRNSLVLLIAVAALVFSAAYLVTPLVSRVLASATVTPEANTNGCQGVVDTPGSENTTKELVGGTLEPGGTASFRFTFPATVNGNPGQEEWKLTDCVFLDTNLTDNKDGDPFQKYTVTALENDVSPVVIEFTLTIPADAPIGAEYCNFGKTTETPSDSQGSNRKAGPACFIIGGALRVTKVDGNGDPLAGATFTVSCDWPDVSAGTFLPDTILSVPTNGSIDGGGSTETINSTDDGSFSRTVVTGDEGVISVNGPEATECTFTETAAPDGYLPPADADCTLIIASGDQGICEFVNELESESASPSVAESVAESASAEQSVAESASAEQSVAASASGEQSVEAGTGTPAESQPNSALSLIGGGALPTIAFSLILLASLAALAYANVKAVRNRS
jgi:Prealbumin-like fold domain